MHENEVIIGFNDYTRELLAGMSVGWIRGVDRRYTVVWNVALIESSN